MDEQSQGKPGPGKPWTPYPSSTHPRDNQHSIKLLFIVVHDAVAWATENSMQAACMTGDALYYMLCAALLNIRGGTNKINSSE